MVIVEADIGLIIATLPPITQVVIREELDLGLNISSTLHLLIM